MNLKDKRKKPSVQKRAFLLKKLRGIDSPNYTQTPKVVKNI